MVLFIKPGHLNGIENRTEYGCGVSASLAQSPLHRQSEYNKSHFLDDLPLMRGYKNDTEGLQKFKISEEVHSRESAKGADDIICANMTNEEFVEEFNEIRDKLINILTNSVIPSVGQWGPATRARAIKWFGTDNEKLRSILANGYPKCVTVLKSMSGENFVKPTNGYLFGCAPNSNDTGVHAAVCPTDSGHHIAIYPDYCDSRKYSSLQDSKIGTILHEVCHFQSSFTSVDHVYSATLSERLAKIDPSKAIGNTDNFVMFALHGVVYGSI